MPDRGVVKTKANPGSSVAQVVETGVGDCAIESVVIYQDRAEIKRAVPVHLTPGENEVIVYDGYFARFSIFVYNTISVSVMQNNHPN